MISSWYTHKSPTSTLKQRHISTDIEDIYGLDQPTWQLDQGQFILPPKIALTPENKSFSPLNSNINSLKQANNSPEMF